MTSFSNRLLAVTAGLCLLAGSASAMEVRVPYTGLNLARPADAKTFETRLNAAADQFCSSRDTLRDRTSGPACRQAIWDEALAQLPPERRDAFEQARRLASAIVSAER